MEENKRQWGEEVFPLLSWFQIEKVKNAKVMVVGAGALGNEVLKNLALFGIGNIFIVDYDTIEYSNLTRSILFRESDADKGLFKAQVAAKRIKEINPGIQVDFLCGNLSTDVGLGIYKQMDVVIACLDSRLARLQLNRICMRAGVPWIDGGIENLEGNVKVFIPGENCYECELSDKTKDFLFHKMSCAGIAKRNQQVGRIATTPVIASVIGAVQVQEAMKLIHKEELEKGVFTSLCKKWFHYEGMHLNTKIYQTDVYDEECPSHEHWDNIVEMPKLSANTSIKDFFKAIEKQFKVKEVTINLRNDKFVDKIVTRSDNQRFLPMLPESKIPQYIDETFELFRRLPSDLYQNTYEDIDNEFPYPDLTLHQIGIPYLDILQITTEKGYHYVLLAKDKKMKFGKLRK
jgi:adenylyltransferase/sulfurtransferase